MKKTLLIAITLLFTISCFLAIGCGKETEKEKQKYIVSFDTQVEGLNIQYQEVKEGDYAKEPPTLIREDGYAFIGWFLDDFRYDFKTSKVSRDLTLTAHWGVAYTVSFQSNTTDFSIGRAMVAEGAPLLESLPEVSREGYALKNWLYFDEPITEFDVMPARNITLSAEWVKVYSVSFDYKENEEPTVAEYAVGDSIIFPTVAKKGKDEFAGWVEDGIFFTSAVMPDRNLTLSASWSKAVTITFDTGEVNIDVPSIVAVAGTAINAPIVPEVKGWRLLSWQNEGRDFDFVTMPEEDITLDANWDEIGFSTLPSLYISVLDKNGQEVSLGVVDKESYVNIVVSVKNTIDEYTLDSVTGEIKGRGNGTWSGDKRGYRIKFTDKQALLGNPESRHWVMYSGKSGPGSFSDPTLLHNYMAFTIGDLALDGIDYVTSVELVDTYVNGEYYGVYVIMEHIRDANDRVDVDAEYNVTDTGYLLEYDAYATQNGAVEGIDYFRVNGVGQPFSVKAPDPEEYLENGCTEAQFRAQIAYIKTQTQALVNSIMNNNYATFCELADEDSFVDMYILHELFKNTDTGYSSFYMGKNAGGEFFCTAPWDFDATAGYNRGNNGPTGLFVGTGADGANRNQMLISLYSNSTYQAKVKARWVEVSPSIKNVINYYMSEKQLDEWQYALGQNYVRWEGARTQEDGEASWRRRAETFKTWLLDRIDWLDTTWKV